MWIGRVVNREHAHLHSGKIHGYHFHLKNGFVKLLGTAEVQGWYFKPTDSIFHVFENFEGAKVNATLCLSEAVHQNKKTGMAGFII
jgi:hypothetical protein